MFILDTKPNQIMSLANILQDLQKKSIFSKQY